MEIIKNISEVKPGDVQVTRFTAEGQRHESTVIAADDATITMEIEVARAHHMQRRTFRNQSYKRTSKLVAPSSFRWYERQA